MEEQIRKILNEYLREVRGLYPDSDSRFEEAKERAVHRLAEVKKEKDTK